MTDTIYGVVGEPRAADHLVVGRSSATVCGKTIGATWLLARGIYTAETFIGSRGACEACSNAVHPPARDGETLSAASVPPESPTLSDEREARLRFLQAEFATSTPSGKYFDRDEMLTLRDDLDALMDTVVALRAEVAEAKRVADQAADNFDMMVEKWGDSERQLNALRAEVAALKSDEERLDWLEKWLPEQPGHRRLVFDRSVPEFTLFQSDDNVRRLGMKKTLRAAIDAARSASGEDAKLGASDTPVPFKEDEWVCESCGRRTFAIDRCGWCGVSSAARETQETTDA